MKYSVIIVNYKTPHLVLDCLQSIYAGTMTDIEIIVVDNASGGDDQTKILDAFPTIKWLQMGYNSGFARANNAGIRNASGDIVLLLNSDTLNENNAVHRCFERLSESNYIAAGVQLLNADRSPQISGNYFMTGALNYFMTLPYLGEFVRWIGLKAGVKKTNVSEATLLTEVDWINGAFLMVKKSVLEKAGLMDEDFFLYSEETEWCSRLNKFGRMCIYGDLHVLHLEGGSSTIAFDSSTKGYQQLTDKKGGQILLSHLVRIRKQLGVFWFIVHLSAHLITIPLFFLIAVIQSILKPKGRKREWKSWKMYCKNVAICCSYVFKILKNKPFFYKII